MNDKQPWLHCYDELDMKHHYNTGFWIGAISGFVACLVMCLLAGVYLVH